MNKFSDDTISLEEFDSEEQHVDADQQQHTMEAQLVTSESSELPSTRLPRPRIRAPSPSSTGCSTRVFNSQNIPPVRIQKEKGKSVETNLKKLTITFHPPNEPINVQPLAMPLPGPPEIENRLLSKVRVLPNGQIVHLLPPPLPIVQKRKNHGEEMQPKKKMVKLENTSSAHPVPLNSLVFLSIPKPLDPKH